MITSVGVAARIWAKTNAIVLLTASIEGIVYEDDGWVALYIGLALIFGFFVTSPLLIFISPIVKLSAALPYANRSKMTWLIFLLSVLYMLIFIVFCGIVQSNFNGVFSKEVALIYLSIVIVEFIAVSTTRKSLYKFYEQFTWSQE